MEKVREALNNRTGGPDGCTTKYQYKYPMEVPKMEDATICYCNTELCNDSKSINSQETKTWICFFILLSMISQHVLRFGFRIN